MVDEARELARLLRERGVEYVDDEGFGVFFEVDGRFFSAFSIEDGLTVTGTMTPEEVVRGLLGPEPASEGGNDDE